MKFFDIQASEKWCDVGCGIRPYAPLFPSGTYIGVDTAFSGRPLLLKAPDVFYDGLTLPFRDESLDGVICTQVLEHVQDPQSMLLECHRVLKPGGGLIISAPFAWQEHEEPYDFFRFSSFSLLHLLNKAGFEVIVVHKTTGSFETMAQLLSVSLVNSLSFPIRGFGKVVCLLVSGPIQIIGLISQRLLPDKGKFFLDSVAIGRRRN